MPALKSSNDSILFIKTSSLGDVVHHMPAATDARQHFPDAQIAWVVEEAFAPLVGLTRPSTRSYLWRRGVWRKQLFKRETWKEIATFRRLLRTSTSTRLLMRRPRPFGDRSRAARASRTTVFRQHRGAVASRCYDVTHPVSRALHAVERNRRLTALGLGYESTLRSTTAWIPSRSRRIATRCCCMAPRVRRRNRRKDPGSSSGAFCRRRVSSPCCLG